MADLSAVAPLDRPAADRELVVDFGARGNSERFRGWGWAPAEHNYSWTLGRSSRVYFRPPVTEGTYLLVMELMPFRWDGSPGQRLKVFVNGGEVGDFLVSRQSTIEATIPWFLIAGREWISVTLEHPDARRPRDISGIDDDREIGLAFERLSLFHQFETAHTASLEAPMSEIPLNELMTQFESLGQNCEFGLVQRQCGAEPLGLLRFASTPMPALMAGLRSRFDGLGDADQLDIELAKDEYLIADRRYGILYHAWVKLGEATPEQVLQREQRRLPFLRQKLIEDLAEGRKIFVYHGMEPLSRSAMLSLVAAMRSYGPASLLWVELADPEHPVGTVEIVTAGLMKGYIDRFAPGENAHELSLEAWITLCRKAHGLSRHFWATRSG